MTRSEIDSEETWRRYHQQLERDNSEKNIGQQFVEWLSNPILTWWFAPRQIERKR
jgi:hypothetical protein